MHTEHKATTTLVESLLEDAGRLNTRDVFCLIHQAGFWRREWQSTPVLLPGESHGQRSLAGYSPWGCKESETTEGVTLFLSERTVFAPSGREQRKGEKQAGSCWGVLQQNFGDLFGFVAPDMLLQVGLSMGLSDTQVSNLAISSRLRFNTRESILGVKNLG